MVNTRQPTAGFTLLELMILIAIVAILAAIAVPTYFNHAREAYFTEMIEAATPFKTAVLQCYQNTGTLTGCNGGSNNIPANITTTKGNIASATVTDGVITITPVAAHGILATDTYVLTPTVTNNTVTWIPSGGGVTEGYARY